LVHGDANSIAKQVEEVKKYPGIKTIITAKHDQLQNPYAI